MRILTVLAGMLVSGCGAFCFAVYTNTFANVAFLVGTVMAASGILNIISYLISGKGENRLTDTALVEGIVTLLYGFAVLNNQVTDQMLTMFFGTWLTLCGVTRFSQSLYISRFNPRDWAKVIPLAAMSATLGVVMMMPKLVSTVMPLMLVGGAFIADGFSMLIYAMYMKRTTTAQIAEGEAKAFERAEARKEAELAKREQRDQLRKLTRKEREEAQKQIRKVQEETEKVKHEVYLAERAARKEAMRSASDRTMEFTTQETETIRAAAAIIKAEEEKKATSKAKESADNPMSQIWKAAESEQMTIDDIGKSSKLDETLNRLSTAQEALEKNFGIKAVDDKQFKPVWQRPTDIPSVRANVSRKTETEPKLNIPRFSAINIEEIETAKPKVEFEKVELPEIKLKSSKEKADRGSILSDIDKINVEKTDVDYTPIDLDELIAEPMAKPVDPKEATRFTQTLNFGWIEDAEKK